MIADYLRDFGLTKLVGKPTMAIVKEFYANVMEKKTIMSFVRGVPIPYTPYYIMDWYELQKI